MDALNALPDWVKIVGVLLAAGLLVALNVGWLLQAKAFLDGQKQRYAERQRQQSDALRRAADRLAADRLAASRPGAESPADRDPASQEPRDRA